MNYWSGWLAGWRCSKQIEQIYDNRLLLSPFSCLLPFFPLHSPPSLSEIIFLFLSSLLSSSLFFFVSLSLPILLYLAFSSCLILGNNHRRTAQEQFILFISSSSSSFLRRHKDGDFFIREDLRSRILRTRTKKTHLNAMLFEKLSFPPIIRYRIQALKARESKEIESYSFGHCWSSAVFGSLTLWLRRSANSAEFCCHSNWWKNNTFFYIRSVQTTRHRWCFY